MSRKPKLSPTMSLADFDNGYWSALEIPKTCAPWKRWQTKQR